jgi:hypothetical protein
MSLCCTPGVRLRVRLKFLGYLRSEQTKSDAGIKFQSLDYLGMLSWIQASDAAPDLHYLELWPTFVSIFG